MTLQTLIRFSVILCLSLTFGAIGFAQETATELPTIKVWPNGLPADAQPMTQKAIDAAKAKSTDEHFHYVDTPILTVYEPPAEKKNGTSVVILSLIHI